MTDYVAMAKTAAEKYGINGAVFSGLIESESSFNPFAVGPTFGNGQTAKGIAQFTDATAYSRGIKNVFDPAESLDASAKYFSELVKKEGSYKDAIARYKGYSNIEKGYSAADAVFKRAQKYGTIDDTVLPKTDDEIADAEIEAGIENQPFKDKSLWQYTSDDLGAALKYYAAGAFLMLAGAGLIMYGFKNLISKG